MKFCQTFHFFEKKKQTEKNRIVVTFEFISNSVEKIIVCNKIVSIKKIIFKMTFKGYVAGFFLIAAVVMWILNKREAEYKEAGIIIVKSKCFERNDELLEITLQNPATFTKMSFVEHAEIKTSFPLKKTERFVMFYVSFPHPFASLTVSN